MAHEKVALPGEVQATIDKLNEGRKKKLAVGVVKGRYYVFDTKNIYSEEKGRKGRTNSGWRATEFKRGDG